MNIQKNDLLNSILHSLDELDYIPLSDFPNINLYMDQLTSFMDSRLSMSKRFSEDKVLTKTMINNYAKNDLLPPPLKKQYSMEHLITLTFIYYFKSILSITDIQKVLDPIHEKYFDTKNYNIKQIYEEVFSLEADAKSHLKEDIINCYSISQDTFCDAPEADRDFLQQFAFICELCFDIYVKKMIVEKLIDGMPDRSTKAKELKEAKKASKAKEKEHKN